MKILNRKRLCEGKYVRIMFSENGLDYADHMNCTHDEDEFLSELPGKIALSTRDIPFKPMIADVSEDTFNELDDEYGIG